MKILISNDDGIFAPGIAALVAAFAGAGHEVIVCAPDSQRSAASHSLSLHTPVSVREMAYPGAARAFAIGGTPVDCVKLGLTVLCPECEAVVSGVNHGLNVGTDILYSGTVGAAMEGAICGRPALAVSQPYAREEYAKAAGLALSLFERMIAHPLGPLSVLNVNYPQTDALRGVVPAAMGPLHYDEAYAPSACEDGTTVYTLSGSIDPRRRQSEDYERLLEGCATITVLRANMTDEDATNAFAALI